ncbi:AIPR family protein [Vallitalea guaymasensis]|uniref:AIPR family protein n=1 Tax=Vallitalea guaymasensis TaxID=1185412 RepID=A0A8J8SBD9_9FIRM|nr:AIPR family protein [Vallitalea guaymasensis]QUH28300.1 AIPR family protein [Vallitalea guaymasensis]
MNNQLRLINSTITRFQKENDLDDQFLFEIFSISQILKSKNIDFVDIENSIVDGGNDGGIDSVIVLVNDTNLNTIEELSELEINRKTELEIFIIQTKDSNSFKERVFDTLSLTFQDVFDYTKELEDLNSRYNHSLVDKIFLLREAIDQIMVTTDKVRINVVYASKGDTTQISNGVKNRAQLLVQTLKEKSSISNCEVLYYGANELRKIFIEPEETELILNYRDSFSSSFLDGSSVGYVLTVNLKDYFNFVTKDKTIRESIFENNVRHFQGSITVNKGINETLKNSEDIEFWWLNNGITILSPEIVPLPDNKLRLKNIQIVNGLQTTFCIYNHYKEKGIDTIDEKRSVLIKIIKTSDQTTMDKIIYSTNSQTMVRAADLRATDELQRNIENYFLSKGYYYDRRKNYYKNMNKDRSKIFNIAKTAQYIETLLFKRPNLARANPTSLLKTDENYSRIFSYDFNIDSYLKACLLHTKVSKFIKKIPLDSDIINIKYGASMKNLSFHLMLITAILYFKNYGFNDTDLANLDLDKIDQKLFNQSLLYLVQILDKLDDTRSIINIAKSSALTKEITNEFINKDKSDYEIIDNLTEMVTELIAVSLEERKDDL